MLQFRNGYDDRVLTVISREVRTGRDGPSIDLEPGEDGSIELDGDFQVVVSTRGREPGEEPIAHPIAQVAGAFTGGDGEGPELIEADDDIVRGEIAHMIENKISLTNAGPPEMDALNARLKDAGYLPINSKKRAELMPTPAGV